MILFSYKLSKKVSHHLLESNTVYYFFCREDIQSYVQQKWFFRISFVILCIQLYYLWVWLRTVKRHCSKCRKTLLVLNSRLYCFSYKYYLNKLYALSHFSAIMYEVCPISVTCFEILIMCNFTHIVKSYRAEASEGVMNRGFQNPC